MATDDPTADRKPKLLAGGNPQIALGLGDAPVQAWIAAAPGWKGEAAARLDVLITRNVADVKKAVKWNTPLYGVEDGVWFLGYHCFNRYLKISFFNGAEFEPPPPITSKHARVRYLHLHETDVLDEAQIVVWLRQAIRLPGEKM